MIVTRYFVKQLTRRNELINPDSYYFEVYNGYESEDTAWQKVVEVLENENSPMAFDKYVVLKVMYDETENTFWR